MDKFVYIKIKVKFAWKKYNGKSKEQQTGKKILTADIIHKSLTSLI